MDYVIWAGTAISVIGLIGLIWCILMVIKAKRAALPDDDMRVLLKKVTTYNMAALFLSVIGLMMVIIGIAFS